MRPDDWSIIRISAPGSSLSEMICCNPAIDTHHAMSESHIFTVPVSGIYQISAFGESGVRSLKAGDILDIFKESREEREKLSILGELGS